MPFIVVAERRFLLKRRQQSAVGLIAKRVDVDLDPGHF